MARRIWTPQPLFVNVLTSGLYSGGLIIGRIFASDIWGAYFEEGHFFTGEGLIFGILRYLILFKLGGFSSSSDSWHVRHE